MVHPALLNVDITTMICQLLDQRSLLAIGMTAKFLLDPALRELWRKIENLSHLLFPFGSCVDRTKAKMTFLNAPNSVQWDRFSLYASRVRHLDLTTNNIDLSCFLVLSLHQPVLPHLQSLVISELCPFPEISCLSIFFVASLRTFEICPRGDVLHLDPLVTTLATAAPALQHLTIFAVAAVLLGFGPSILSFQNLSSIDIPIVGSPDSILSHLSSLPSLSFVKFQITPWARISGTGPIYSFPAALGLIIFSDSYAQATRFMATTQFEKLITLKIGWLTYQSIDESSLFKNIALHCGQSLDDIEINGGYINSDPPTIKFSVIRPLYIFTNIYSFCVGNPISYPTNDDAEEIVKSWPELMEFHVQVGDSNHLPEVSPLTLTGLMLLIEQPNLMAITIAVNATQLPSVRDPISSAGFSLTILPWNSLMECPKLLADYLTSVLPDAHIGIGGHSNSTNYTLWKEAESHIDSDALLVLAGNAMAFR